MSGKQGRIYTAEDLTKDVDVSCDVCVVGSGAGGGILAHALVERGLSVVMLEEGPYATRRDFDMQEATAYPRFYQELGNRTTDDQSICILQGRTVGGGTTVNWCASFRPPDAVLELWKQRHGVEGLSPETLAPHFDWIEQRLNMVEWPEELLNRNNRILWEGLGKAGYARSLVKRNVKACANLGYCGLGCPTDAKLSTLVTVIPDAVERGMTLYANTFAERIETNGRKAVAVHAQVLHPDTDKPTGIRVTVRPKAVAVCGGAINSPALLLRSELEGRGNVGKRLFLHPVVASSALFDEPVEAYYGAPLAVVSTEFSKRGKGKVGFVLETPPIHPMLAATVFGGFGANHQSMIEQLSRTQAIIAIAADGILDEDEGGTVSLRKGARNRYHVNYPLRDFHWEALRLAQKEMARLQFAAGARQVATLHTRPLVLKSAEEIDLLDAAPYAPLELKVVTAHQMGGCAMGRDAESSVVDSTLRYHDADNLFVVDGSAFPTGLGINPMETILGLARWGSQHVIAAV